MSKTRKQTLAQAVRLIRSGKGLEDIACGGLDGCPVGGWGETQQAIRQMVEALPHRSERSYTVYDLIDVLYKEDSTGRWRWIK